MPKNHDCPFWEKKVPMCMEPCLLMNRTFKFTSRTWLNPPEQRRDEPGEWKLFLLWVLPLWWRLLIDFDSSAEKRWPAWDWEYRPCIDYGSLASFCTLFLASYITLFLLMFCWCVFWCCQHWFSSLPGCQRITQGIIPHPGIRLAGSRHFICIFNRPGVAGAVHCD